MTDTDHDAPAEGAGERDYPAEFEAWWQRHRNANREKADYNVKKQIAFDAFYHGARSSAPEAREEALGNLLAVIHGDGGHRALEVGTKQAALEAEKIVAGLFAAPSADKLRIATDAFDAITDLSTALRNGGPDGSDLHDLSDNLNTAVDLAHEALAALKAEAC